MVTFPLHTVTFPWYSVLFMGSAYQQQQGFFNPLGALFWLLQVSKMQVSRPVRSLRSDSLRREPIIYSGTQPNYFTKHLPATSSFLFRQQQPIQTNQLLLRNSAVGVLRTLENVGRIENECKLSVTYNSLPNLNRGLVGRRR